MKIARRATLPPRQKGEGAGVDPGSFNGTVPNVLHPVCCPASSPSRKRSRLGSDAGELVLGSNGAYYSTEGLSPEAITRLQTDAATSIKGPL